jgi:hypothetical protein
MELDRSRLIAAREEAVPVETSWRGEWVRARFFDPATLLRVPGCWLLEIR